MEKRDLFWFFTKSEYEDAKNDLSIPYVAYIKATDEVIYKQEEDPTRPLRIWIDDFPEDVDYEHTKEEFIETPENFGSHSYICQGETMEIEGETYYLWEFDSSVGTDGYSSQYLLTTTNNYATLYSESMEDDLNNTFVSYVGMLDSNDELYRVHDGSDKDQMLLKVEYL